MAKNKSVKKKKINKVMHEYEEGKLRSGSKKGPVVENKNINKKQIIKVIINLHQNKRKNITDVNI